MSVNAKEINLDEIVEEFNAWYGHHEDLVHRKEGLENEVRLLQKQHEMSEEKHANTTEDFQRTQEMVSKLQGMLKMSCDLEDDNMQLKDKVTNLMDELAAVKEEHKLALAEAEKLLDETRQAHKEEMELMQENATAQRKSDVGLLKESLQQKMADISQLQKQLADLERDKHTELARLRLEYDAKLLKLQKETTRAQQQNAKSANKGNDIFRQKLLNVRSEADREVGSLKRTISDLQRRLDAQTGGTFGPKRKF